MLKSTDILLAIREKIKSEYHYSVYLDDSKENCDSSCFFLSLNIFRRHSGLYKVFCEGQIHLTYFAKKHDVDALEFYEIKDNVSKMFYQGFSAQDRFIKIKNLSAMTSGEDADIIQFEFQFEYFDVYEKMDDEKQYLIQNIEYKTEV